MIFVPLLYALHKRHRISHHSAVPFGALEVGHLLFLGNAGMLPLAIRLPMDKVLIELPFIFFLLTHVRLQVMGSALIVTCSEGVQLIGGVFLQNLTIRQTL